MNWKLVTGILIVFGGTGEFFAEMSDYNNGVTTYNPIYAQLGCITLICAGLYLAYTGWKQRKPSNRW